MCFPPMPRVECSNKDVFNLFIVEEERIDVENHLQIVNRFFQLLLGPIEPKLVEEHH